MRQSLCPACKYDGTCQAESIVIRNVQSDGEPVHLRTALISGYQPVLPQPKDDTWNAATHDRLKFYGYLFNGMKSGKVLSPNLIQINLCQDHMVKYKSCFEREDGESVTLTSATIRLFDVDQKERAWQAGPEVMQFWCPGGTFSLFGGAPTPKDKAGALGSHPYVSHNAGEPISVEPGFTPVNKLTKSTWACPMKEPVTIWSKRTGVDGDNPESSAPDSLNEKQETSMVEVNYKHVSCFDFTMANLPPKYHQMPVKHNGQWKLKGWPFKSASEGGNPLNGTTELTESSFGLQTRGCNGGEAGRNWLLSGSCTGAACDATRSARAVSQQSQANRELLQSVDDRDAPGHRLWKRRMPEDAVGRALQVG
jgi:hypothetical protein